MLRAGQRVLIDFSTMTLEGVVTRDCADWGSCPVHLVEDGDDTGTEICARTWNADNVAVVEEG